MEPWIWNAVISIVVGTLGWFFKELSAELKRITKLLNQTREEVAKEYVTKSEVHADINRVLDRLERLDMKLDRLMERRRANDE
jgi:Tfp pilus assembly protein PilO